MVYFSSKGCYADDSNNLAMFKAVLKKNRDGGKGSKKDSGMWKIRRKTGNKNSVLQRIEHKLSEGDVYRFICDYGNFS